MTSPSPFRQHRWEYERKHVYYLPPGVMDRLEALEPTYLFGTRGTGKTTLLKAMTWNERVSNESLRRQLGDDPFENKYVGVYFKVPKIQLSLFERWLLHHDRDICADTMALYLGLVISEELASAIAALLAHRAISCTPEKEAAAVHSVVARYEHMARFSNDGARSFLDLSQILRRSRTALSNLAKVRGSIDYLVEHFPIERVGTFGTEVAKALVGVLDDAGTAVEENWRFYVCMDEGEALTGFQQLVLNTWVRIGEAPLFLVVAFVGAPHNPTATLEEGLSLQRADRLAYVLDDMSDTEFRRFSEGVVSERTKAILTGSDAIVDVEQILGPLDLNGILHDSLGRSVNKQARELVDRSREIATEPFFAEKSKRKRRPVAPPIYQTYLIQTLDLTVPDPSDPIWARRAQESAELRKQNVAAYLSICEEFGLDPRYASADMLFQMCDGCVRDFLWQMQEIFLERGEVLEDFLVSRVPAEEQDRALKRASKNKVERLPKSVATGPQLTARLVDGLARLTSRLQRTSHDGRHLRTPERGRFVVTQPDESTPHDSLALVQEAADAGFLRLKSEDPTWVFQVHTSLAAQYGFSYRGAQNLTRLTLDDIEAILAARTTSSMEEVVASVQNRLDRAVDGAGLGQLDLFGGSDE